MSEQIFTDEDDGSEQQSPSAVRREWAQQLLETVAKLESNSPEYHPSWYRNGTMREEAHRTIEGQLEWVREIDSKAMMTLRFNTILLGLVVPAFSFAVQYGIVDDITAFYTYHTKLGISCLIVSTAFAGVTYTSSSIDAGISSSDIRTANKKQLADKEVHDTIIDSYKNWIDANRETIFWNTILVTITILLMIYALAFLSLGITSALTDGLSKNVEYSSYVGLLVITILSQLL